MTNENDYDVDISVLSPVYNEKENLQPLVEQIDTAMTALDVSYEILLIDDKSTDGSLDEMRRLQDTHPHLRVIGLDRNQGQSAAFGCGFAAARGRYIVTLDADLQNDPADIEKLLALKDQYDLVVGWRKNRKDTAWRRFCSKWANRYRNWKNRETIHDTGCSLKLIPKDIAVKLPVFNGMHRFIPTLARLCGARVGETVVSHRDRLAGVSKYGFWNRAWRGVQDTKGINWLKTRWVSFHAAEYSAKNDQPVPIPDAKRFEPIPSRGE